MDRVDSGELVLERLGPTPKMNPRIDGAGNLIVANEMNNIRDFRFSPSDWRHICAKTHRHITDKGEAGESGLHDPKTIRTVDFKKYILYGDQNPRCEICEGGDMIAPEKRFRYSKYKPLK